MANPWDNGAYANDTYLQSLKASSADVARQVQNALGEIDRQRKVAGAQTAKIQGAAGTAFGTGQDRMTSGLNELGVAPLASVLNAFAAGKESFGRASGLLNQGFDEQRTLRQGRANNLKQQLLADLQRQGAQYVSQREGEDRQRAFQEAENARNRAVQEQIARMAAAASRGGGGGSLYQDPAQAFDEGFYRAVAAYGDEGGRNWLKDNERPGGLTQGQREFLARTNPYVRRSGFRLE